MLKQSCGICDAVPSEISPPATFTVENCEISTIGQVSLAATVSSERHHQSTGMSHLVDLVASASHNSVPAAQHAFDPSTAMTSNISVTDSRTQQQYNCNLSTSSVASAGVSCNVQSDNRGCGLSGVLTSEPNPASTSTSEDCQLSNVGEVSPDAVGGRVDHQRSTDIPPRVDQEATISSESVLVVPQALPPSTTPVNDISNTESRTQGHCNSKLCVIHAESILAVNEMMTQITNASTQCLQLYMNINNCRNTQKNPYKLGHSLSCTTQNGCSSLLKHARLIACHFSGLKSVIQRVYQLRRLSLCIHTVQQARCSGDFKFLRDAIEDLKLARAAATNGREEKLKNEVSGDRQPATGTADETEVVSRFGKQLIQVANDRDSYVTTTCDLCEQLKPNLRTLKSLENRKGFDSEKMASAVDILYQYKT